MKDYELKVRFPRDWGKKLKEMAKEKFTSINSIILIAVKRIMDEEK